MINKNNRYFGNYNLLDLSEDVNDGKEEFLKQMVKENIITQEKSDEMMNYSIICAPRGFFGSWWNKIWSKKEDSKEDVIEWEFKIVKMCEPPEEKEDKDVV